MMGLSRILALMALIFISCKNEKEGEGIGSEIRDRYYRLEHNGWKSRVNAQKIKGINYTATEVPIVYYILKSRGTDNLVNADSIYEANKTERVIEFDFLHEEEKDLLNGDFTAMDFESAVKYLSFSISKDFSVVTTSKHDTIPCTGVLYERQFKLSPGHKILLFFSGINSNDNIQLIYKDQLFNQGTMKFQFDDKPTKILL